jgi:hypothetical protein
MPDTYSPHPDYDFPRNFKGFGEAGLNPKWPNDAKIAVSFVINYEEVTTAAPSCGTVKLTPDANTSLGW